MTKEQVEKAADIEAQPEEVVMPWRHADDDEKWPIAFKAGAAYGYALAEKRVKELEESLSLSAKCLKIQAQELGAAVKEIDDDPFENWDEGRKSLRGIYARLKIAADNAAKLEKGADE